MSKLPRSRYFVSSARILQHAFDLQLTDMDRGPRTVELERRLASAFEVNTCATFSSFRIGLYFVLEALGLEEGDEVLLPPITIPDAVNVIRVLGLKPVFVDMNPDDHGIDLADLHNKLTDRSRVLLLTHLSGLVPDMKAIMAIVDAKNLVLLEDVSQAYGAEHDGTRLGTFGRAGIGSLTVGKTISALLGGFVISDDEAMLDRMRASASKRLRRPKKLNFVYPLLDNFGMNVVTSKKVFPWLTYSALRLAAAFEPDVAASMHERRLVAQHSGLDLFFDDVPVLRDSLPDEFFFWLSDWQAGLALEMVGQFEAGNQKRRRLARALYDALSPNARRLLPGCITNFDWNTYYHFPIMVDGDRTSFQIKLLEHGIDSGGYGLNLCTEESVFECYASPTPNAARIKHGVLFLPLQDQHSEREMREVADAVNACVQ